MGTDLKILYPIASFFPAQNGGPDNTVYWITKTLSGRGFRPVIAADDPGLQGDVPRDTWLQTDYGEVIYTHDWHPFFPFKVIWNAFTRLPEVDLLHFNLITCPSGIVTAVLNSWFYGRPMIWSARGALDPFMLLRSPRRKSVVIWLINNLVTKRLLWFHSTCDAETLYIREHFGKDAKVVLIPNYMELPKPLHLPKKRFLLYLGRIDPKKGIENLLDAVAGSRSFQSSDFTLKIVGSYRTEYGYTLVERVRQLRLEHKVEFLGHLAGRDKECILAEAHFAFMPSHTENFGVVVLEALAQGTPAVAGLNTPWKLLHEYDAGYWVDNSVESLINTVEEVIQLTPERISELQHNALELARNRFDINKHIEEWINFYRLATT